MRKNKDLFSIFPADAGVNPIKRLKTSYSFNIPRGCGGEPKMTREQELAEEIFPADAGVNLAQW